MPNLDLVALVDVGLRLHQQLRSLHKAAPGSREQRGLLILPTHDKLVTQSSPDPSAQHTEQPIKATKVPPLPPLQASNLSTPPKGAVHCIPPQPVLPIESIDLHQPLRDTIRYQWLWQ
jgi:hypothetical protein